MARMKILVLLACIVGCSERRAREPWGVPITGGTMLVTRDGAHLVVSDPDRDRILSVDLATRAVTSELALEPHDEPGRLIEDGAGRIHVALRRGGALLTLAGGVGIELASRRYVCPEPRGLAWDAATDLIHVACTGGELVSLPASGGDAVRSVRLDRDLRDVVVTKEGLVVSRFRSAELLIVDAEGSVARRASPPNVARGAGQGEPEVAWRMIAMPDGRIVVSHQRHVTGGQQAQPYGVNPCAPSVEAAISVMQPGAAPVAVGAFADGALPVDIAVSPGGDSLALIMAGSRRLTVVGTDALEVSDHAPRCVAPALGGDARLGAPTSIAFLAEDQLAVLYPEAPAIVLYNRAGATLATITLSGRWGDDAGRDLFHRQTRSGLACASCHAEGRDDGRVWDFGMATRRTQSLAGHILERGPYHWNGDLATLPALVDDVFGARMGGGEADARQKNALGQWLESVPAPAPLASDDPAARARGAELFAGELGCADCHAGELHTTNTLVNVGTGGTFKVPSLVGLGTRAPYMHDGCAATLFDRFTLRCGGGDAHGHTSQLTAAQIADVVAYLESL